ncbi:hypothetical protein CCR75_009204 [Bremia lactucae]|uniref:Uncharacterized protein n=1 Tax=Bremia lactucae TaxID=4779 RepID=A0A976FJ43_BRELC|nr:hypothetical protein CCR75_009204 [Bremia lactucae]
MADMQSKINAHQHELDRAREQIDDTTQKADNYLTDLTKRVEEYEKKHADFEPAGHYLKSMLDASRSATQKLKTQSQKLSERSVPTAMDGMQAVQKSLDELQQQAIQYDDKFAGSRGQQAADTLHQLVNAGRQRVTDAAETTTEGLTKLRDIIGNMADQATHGAQVVMGEAARAAEAGDKKLGVTSTTSGVVQKVIDLDARLGVTSTAAKVDSKITGGLGRKVAETTVEIVNESVNYISETLHNAKLAAQHSETAQSVEAKASAVTDAAAAKSDDMKQTVAGAFEKGKEKVGMATQKTEEVASAAKDTTLNKAEQVKETASEAKDSTLNKAEHVKEVASDKAGQAMDKASEFSEKTKDQVGHSKEMVNDKVGQVKDKAGDMAENAKDKMSETKEMTKERAGEATEAAKDKGNMVKDKSVESVESSKDSAQNTAGQVAEKVGEKKDEMESGTDEAKEKSKSVLGRVAEKAGEVKENVKDKISTVSGIGNQKPKEPSLTQGENATEIALESSKQRVAKNSEAAQTASGSAVKGEYSGNKQKSGKKSK